jgi:hypothetical protein
MLVPHKIERSVLSSRFQKGSCYEKREKKKHISLCFKRVFFKSLLCGLQDCSKHMNLHAAVGSVQRCNPIGCYCVLLAIIILILCA